MALSGVEEWRARTSFPGREIVRALNYGPGAWAMGLWDAPTLPYGGRVESVFLYSALAGPSSRPIELDVCKSR